VETDMSFVRHPLQFAENTIYGDKVLSILQDQSTPVLDLLVREAVQNSLDAALGVDTNVEVSFDLREIDPSKLLNMMDLENDGFNELRALPKLFEIRDTGTHGLTGETSMAHMQSTGECGNFLKLIFSLGVNQEKQGAGGSWGLGKTIFFRPGKGLVFFYSKLETGENRLAGCWVENQKEEGFLKKLGIMTGVCWWGKKDSTLGNRAYLDPFTDEQEIAEILACLGSRPFAVHEYGTAVIMPFLNDKICNTMNDCSIIKSIFKWYFPRLFSTWKKSSHIISGGPRLIAKVNGTVLNPMHQPFFLILNMLHVYALQNQIPEGMENINGMAFDPKSFKRLEVKYYQNTVLGWLAWTILDSDILGLKNGFPSPDEIIFGNNDDNSFPDTPTGKRDGGGSPLLLMARRPGMIIQYTTDNDWVGTGTVEPGQWMVGIFVVNSPSPVIESYFRACENAVHMQWSHPSDSPINYIRHVQRKIRDHFNQVLIPQPVVNKNVVPAFELSRKLAELFMPKDGFGSGATVLSKPYQNDSAKKGRHRSRITLKADSEVVYKENNTASLQFTADIPPNKKNTIEICVVKENGFMDMTEWRKEYGSLPYPFRITGFEISTLKLNATGSILSNIDEIKRLGVKWNIQCAAIQLTVPKMSSTVKLCGCVSFTMQNKDLSFILEPKSI
jgi:hypothetical protein